MKRFITPLLFAVSLGCLSTAQGAATNVSFVVQINTIFKNTTGINIAVGDLVGGQYTINPRYTNDTTPGSQFSVYSVEKGASVSVVVACTSTNFTINEVDIFNDYALGSTGQFLDRFFVNAGDYNSGGNGIQFWVDQQGVFPTLLASRDIPTVPLDLGVSTSSTFLVRTASLEFQADFRELRDKGPSAILPKTKCNGPR